MRDLLNSIFSLALSVTGIVYFYSLALMLAVLLLAVIRRITKNKNESEMARYRLLINDLLVEKVEKIEKNFSFPKIKTEKQFHLFLFIWLELFKTEGTAKKEKLIHIAHQIQIPNYLLRQLKRHYGVRSQYAIVASGCLQESRAWSQLLKIAHSTRYPHSLLAFQALAKIDFGKAKPILVDELLKHKKWPRDEVMQIFYELSKEDTAQIVLEACHQTSSENWPSLIDYLRVTDTRSFGSELNVFLNSSNPEVLSATLRLIDDPKMLPSIYPFIDHPAWFVRLQVAKALGRMQREDSVVYLKKLLSDSHFLVAYRAAEAFVSLKLTMQEKQNHVVSLNRQAQQMVMMAMQERGLA